MNGSWTDFEKSDNFGTARDVVSNWSQMEEMNERLRLFVEECDHIQVLSFPNKYQCILYSQFILRFMFTYALCDFCITFDICILLRP